jgi:hypothetical protein
VLDATTPPDLACDDTLFGSGAGQTFKACLECELASTFVDPTGLSDLTAAICMSLVHLQLTSRATLTSAR